MKGSRAWLGSKAGRGAQEGEGQESRTEEIPLGLRPLM